MKLEANVGLDLGYQNSEFKHGDEFLPTLIYIFTSVRWLGIPSYGGTIAHCWAFIVLGFLAALEIGALWKLFRLLAGVATNTADGRGFTARLSGSIFYANALLSHVLCWKLISSWKSVSEFWKRAETTGGLYFDPDCKIKKRMIFVTSFVTVCALVEHAMSMISATGFDIPSEEYFQRYILSSHGFLLQPHEYNLWVGIPVFVLSKLATFLWNFQDLIIILISMGLTSRYHRLNLYVYQIVSFEKKDKNVKKFGTELYAQVHTWRRLREAFVKQSALVKRVDQELGKLILLCNMNNFYFICLQLFLGINQNINTNSLNRIYYMYSLGWLLFRACSVVLAAADVNLHSKRALTILYGCPDSAYNVEIKRLENQLMYDVVSLSGMGFYYLDRQLLLEVAAAILKYELVMIQYDKQ